MSESKHTPGPWKFDKEYGNAMDELYCPDGRAIAAIWTRRAVGQSRIRESYKPFDEGMANARLIASAPELLEALEKVLDLCLALNAEQPAYYDHVAVKRACTIADARAAIAKAKGI